MAFLSCEEMLAAARSQKITLAEAVLRSDLEESRLTEAHSRAAMRHLWQVMQATSQEYDPTQRSRSGLSGGDAAKVEQAWQQGRLLGDDYLAAVTAEALKTAECNACMKRIVAAPTAGSCGVLPAVLIPLAEVRDVAEETILQALYIFFTALVILVGFFMLFCSDWSGWMGGKGILLMILGPIAVRLSYELVMMAVLAVKNIISINSKLRNQNEGAAGTDIFDPDMRSLKEAFGVKEEQAAKAGPVESAPVQETKGTPEQ